MALDKSTRLMVIIGISFSFFVAEISGGLFFCVLQSLIVFNLFGLEFLALG